MKKKRKIKFTKITNIDDLKVDTETKEIIKFVSKGFFTLQLRAGENHEIKVICPDLFENNGGYLII